MGEAREVARGSAEYPARLLALAWPPDRLFLEGPWNDTGPRVAIVGSRQADDHGQEFTVELAANLAGCGVAVISGLARGIDAAAHRGALEAGGKSGAVLGTPLDRYFPRDHRELQESCAASLGLLTEHPSGAPVTRGTFATRNRILAAMADAVILVQGDDESGALLTVDAARRLGRPVGAVPWDPRDRLAAAPLRLLHDRAATVVRGAGDVMAMLGLDDGTTTAPARAAGVSRGTGAAARGTPATPPIFPEPERRLFESLRFRSEPLEIAAARASLTIAEASAALVGLELLGWAAREPGGFARRRRQRAREGAGR